MTLEHLWNVTNAVGFISHLIWFHRNSDQQKFILLMSTTS
jgi:hypothetical protein